MIYFNSCAIKIQKLLEIILILFLIDLQYKPAFFKKSGV